MNESLPNILCVDDEPNLLSALRRTLEGDYTVRTAASGADAIAVMQAQGSFDLIISDMRMPGMDGATLLTYVREHWPDTMRILLTGYADTQSAMAAINSGEVFRFLTKPCPHDVLLRTVRLALARSHELKTERQLLETTVAATVKTLADILALASPMAFWRASLARSCVTHALAKLKWPQTWIYECAAALSQIGTIGVPEETLRRDTAQRALTAADARMLEELPDTAYRLLKEIPRLEKVAEIVRYQMREPPAGSSTEVVRGAQLLHAALTLVPYLLRGHPIRKGLDALRESSHRVDKTIVDALSDFRVDPGSSRASRIADLLPGWVLGENVSTVRGQLLLSKGHELTEAAIFTLRRLSAAHLIADPIYVQVNAESSKDAASASAVVAT
jgi:response regulator RpfG family c-di-GMP phosphodiesterase